MSNEKLQYQSLVNRSFSILIPLKNTEEILFPLTAGEFSMLAVLVRHCKLDDTSGYGTD
jgi:hypothetical protein